MITLESQEFQTCLFERILTKKVKVDLLSSLDHLQKLVEQTEIFCLFFKLKI